MAEMSSQRSFLSRSQQRALAWGAASPTHDCAHISPCSAILVQFHKGARVLMRPQAHLYTHARATHACTPVHEHTQVCTRVPRCTENTVQVHMGILMSPCTHQHLCAHVCLPQHPCADT